MAKKKKYYVVWKGVNPGIYDTWADCQLQIKGYPGAEYKSFKSRAEAEAAFEDTYDEAKSSKKAKPKPSILLDEAAIEWDSIAVDAACSGNPGEMEYQGVDTKTGGQYFHQKFPLGTNNIGEFLAIVHGLAMLQKSGSKKPIYSDSKIAMGWVKKGKCKTTLPHNHKTAKLHEVIERAEKWLSTNTFENPLLKWETDQWGEIPADFGRK